MRKIALKRMANRWERDVAALAQSFSTWTSDEDGYAYSKLVRNLESAIAWMDGLIAMAPSAKRKLSARAHPKTEKEEGL